MRTLIISDAHGNLAALKTVLAHARRYAVEEVWYLGDAAGYGPLPYQVWLTLRGLPIPPGGWLAGNHEWGLLGRLRGPALIQPDPNNEDDLFEIGNFRRLAWLVLEKQKPDLVRVEKMWDHLESLPVMSSPRPGIYLAHGAFSTDLKVAVGRYTRLPVLSASELAEKFHAATSHVKLPSAFPRCGRSPDRATGSRSGDRPEQGERGEYSHEVKLPSPARSAVPGGDADKSSHLPSPPRLFAVGHTHIPGIWRWQPEAGDWQRQSLEAPVPLGDLEHAPLFLNPGSVGFPRDGYGCPSYMVVDWGADPPVVIFERIWYNVESIRERMRKEPYAHLLAEDSFLPDPRCAEKGA